MLEWQGRRSSALDAAAEAFVTAAAAGQRVGNSPELRAGLEAALADRDAAVVRAAAKALKAQAVPGHEAMIARLASSPDPAIRSAAR